MLLQRVTRSLTAWSSPILGHSLAMRRLATANAPRAVLFPGQGSQYVGMGKDLYDRYPRSAKLVFEEADEALQDNLSSIIFNGQQDELKRTENAQPAIMTTSIALLRVLETEFGFDINQACQYALGHSLGEYTALVATRSLSLSDAVRLVRLRGQAMTRAVADRQGRTAMSALVVRRGYLEKLEEAIERIQASLPHEVVEVANVNSSFQVVISGTSAAVDEASRTVQAERYAARAVDLPVSAPFHCRLMKSAAKAMDDALKQVHFETPSLDIIANVTAKPMGRVEQVRPCLVDQVTGTVQWMQSISYCKDHQVNEFLCFGPGKVLANLLKKEYPLDRIITLTSVTDLIQYAKEHM